MAEQPNTVSVKAEKPIKVTDNAYMNVVQAIVAQNIEIEEGMCYVLEDAEGRPVSSPINAAQLISNVSDFERLMMTYRCACMEVETKLNVLNEEFSLAHDRNPFESIESRIKSPESIITKMKRKNIPFSVENVEKNLNDVAGVRVICSFPDDVYTVRDMLVNQDDIRLIAQKDYIQKPKPNGYRSLHLILEVPIFLANEKRNVRVEVQIRTIAMDFWASLEHKLRYKKDIPDADKISVELKACADISALLDIRMEEIQKKLDVNS